MTAEMSLAGGASERACAKAEPPDKKSVAFLLCGPRLDPRNQQEDPLKLKKKRPTLLFCPAVGLLDRHVRACVPALLPACACQSRA
jgi:hypothetical protein